MGMNDRTPKNIILAYVTWNFPKNYTYPSLKNSIEHCFNSLYGFKSLVIHSSIAKNISDKSEQP